MQAGFAQERPVQVQLSLPIVVKLVMGGAHVHPDKPPRAVIGVCAVLYFRLFIRRAVIFTHDTGQLLFFIVVQRMPLGETIPLIYIDTAQRFVRCSLRVRCFSARNDGQPGDIAGIYRYIFLWC